MIQPDGSIQGQWGGQFKIRKDVDFQVMGCRFKGFADSEQVYSDEQGGFFVENWVFRVNGLDEWGV